MDLNGVSTVGTSLFLKWTRTFLTTLPTYPVYTKPAPMGQLMWQLVRGMSKVAESKTGHGIVLPCRGEALYTRGLYFGCLYVIKQPGLCVTGKKYSKPSIWMKFILLDMPSRLK